jgi:hypothetical protein
MMKKMLLIIGFFVLIGVGCSNNDNKPPVLTSTRNIIVDENTPMIYRATASDPENQPIVINFANYPDWLVPIETMIRGDTPWGLAETTLFTFSVLVSDGANDESYPVSVQVCPTNQLYLSFYPRQREVGILENTMFTVALNNIENMFAISFDVTCDTNVAFIYDVNIPQPNLIGDGGVYFYHSIPGGLSVFMGRTQTEGDDNITGGGQLIQIYFKGIANGVAGLGFSNVLIVDENGVTNNRLGELYRGSAILYVS